MPSPVLPNRLQVALLCAQWCGVCRDFHPAFAELAQAHPEVDFAWVDVEDDAELVDDLDVENFPTVVIGVNGEPVFHGTVLPHAQTLERLLQQAPDMRALRHHDHVATLQALLAHLQGKGRN